MRKDSDRYLERLGFHVSAWLVAGRKEEVLHVTVPEWRPAKDISIPEDLVEKWQNLWI